MSDLIRQAIRCLPYFIPILAVSFASIAVNLKRRYRSKQILMPILAIGYGVFAILTIIKLHFLLEKILLAVLSVLLAISDKFQFLANTNYDILIFFVACPALMVMFLVFKGIVIRFFRVFMRGRIHAFLTAPFYEKDEEVEEYYLREEHRQTRGYLLGLYIVAILFLTCVAAFSLAMCMQGRLRSPFYCFIPILIIGEFAFALGGLTREEMQDKGSAELSEPEAEVDLFATQRELKKLFRDKLEAENYQSVKPTQDNLSVDEVLRELEEADAVELENYGRFIRSKISRGLIVDKNYLAAGRRLMEGKSLLINNPFYYDMLPYLFFPMHHLLLNHKKILVLVGRKDAEEQIKEWVLSGMEYAANTRYLWKVEVLGNDTDVSPHVGIITHEKVADLEFHVTHADLFEEVGLVVLVEASKLMLNAQIGLNSLIRTCKKQDENVVFCSIDQNCDGLVDALSHVLMTDVGEVSATNHSTGNSLYMCWEGDDEHLQHRIIPNLSRFLGLGTELSMVALKNKMKKAEWYGGSAFPVTDVGLIAEQYYYDLLAYSKLPVSQQIMKEHFHTSSQMWDAQIEDDKYCVVEDENNNMFEVLRNFATRAKKNGFINVISSEYLLRDYMADNHELFRADSKAIPYIVADYAHTARNVVYRLCLRMYSVKVWAHELERELLLVDAYGPNLKMQLWELICACSAPVGKERQVCKDKEEVLVLYDNGKEYHFHSSVIRTKRRYDADTQKMQDCYYIEDKEFVRLFILPLCNAEYIAEDEQGDHSYLGGEIRGQIFQKYMPGQFTTMRGKNYEMMRTTADGKVVFRRAFDHIVERPSYRQERAYEIHAIKPSEIMGATRDRNGMKISICNADFTVKSNAYWHMHKQNDFQKARRVEVNGIPVRSYYNKHLLRITFAQNVSQATCQTLALLMNELFRTLYANDWHYIAAVAPGDVKLPITYSVKEDGKSGEACIYIIEDCQLDVGLLESVDRNLDRIFSILCDYLEWHSNKLAQEGEITDEEDNSALESVMRMAKFGFRKKKDKDAEAEETATKEAAEAAPEETTAEENATTDEDSAEETPAETVAEEAPKEETPETPSAETPEPEVPAPEAVPVDFGFEGEGATTAENAYAEIKRLPYAKRHFLLYGGEQMPETLDIDGVHELLKGYGYDKGELKQARDGKDLGRRLKRSGKDTGDHYCDFCGCQLEDNNYEVLKDGRERCMNCGRTSIKSEKEFIQLYKTVAQDFNRHFGVKLTTPITVKMVSARTLHRNLGKTFIPSGQMNARAIGVAIKDRKGYRILIENGAPKVRTKMTMIHEMTHIWQYLNWDMPAIKEKYGEHELEIYEGMSSWVEIQYAFLMGEYETGLYSDLSMNYRDDEYSRGYHAYKRRYPVAESPIGLADTPFEHVDAPL